MASLVEVVPTSIGKLELPHDLIGQVLGFLDGRSLSSFEITCVLTRQYIRDHPGHFKHLLLRELYNFPTMKSLRIKEGKRALITWDGGDFQHVSASRASMIAPSARYLHRVTMACDGWYYLFGGHLRLGMSGEVWRFRTEERGHHRASPKVFLKWEQIDGDAVEGVAGWDDAEDDVNDLDSETHHLSEESDLESVAGCDGGGGRNGGGGGANSDDEDGGVENNGHDAIPIGLFASQPLMPNHPAAALYALAAADTGHFQANVVAPVAAAGLQAGLGPGPAFAGGGGGFPNPAGLDPDGNPVRPSPRCAPSWTCIPGSNRIYLFGGLGSDNNFLGDLWCFHIGSRSQARWELLRALRDNGEDNPELEGGEVAVPAGRWGHTMVEHNGMMFMFGGSSPGQAYTGLWRLNASVRPCRWSLLKTRGGTPPPRGGHSATVVRDTLYIFGGNITQSVFNDLWSIDLPAGNCWRHIATTSDFPSPRIGHSAVAMGDRILIFGGRNFNTGKFTAGLSCFDTKKDAFVRFPHVEAFTKRASQSGGMWFNLRMTGHAAVPCSRGILFVGGLVHNGHSTMGTWVLDTVRGRHSMVHKRRRRRKRALATTGGCSPS